MLDLYCYGGGFALNAIAGGARSALLVDESARALELARDNAALQEVADRVETREGEVFDVVEELARERRRFGLVIADPPSFVKSRSKIATGLRAYRRLAEGCARLVAENGVLCMACCSHNVSAEEFRREVLTGIRAASRGARQLLFAGAAPDHPVHPTLAESAYLKFYAFALD
ncbi:Ribosomal RNA large subunit methyltransferase I [bacterium HR39]|nr:Ribosomal RNA large subunit methyltransferase I [bacterium HR39]